MSYKSNKLQDTIKELQTANTELKKKLEETTKALADEATILSNMIKEASSFSLTISVSDKKFEALLATANTAKGNFTRLFNVGVIKHEKIKSLVSLLLDAEKDESKYQQELKNIKTKIHKTNDINEMSKIVTIDTANNELNNLNNDYTGSIKRKLIVKDDGFTLFIPEFRFEKAEKE